MDVKDFAQKRDGVRVVVSDNDQDEVKLIPLGDVHLGSATCQTQKFLDTIKYIKDSGSQVILMGDLMECASRHSVGAGWVEQEIDPQTQIDYLVKALKPIADQILVSLEGNHEFRVWKQTGLKATKIMADLLGVKYGGYSTFIKMKVRKFNYIIHAQHGSSNAWYSHTKLTAAMKTAQHTDADVYLYGHTHALMSLKTRRRTLDLRSRTVKRDKKYFVLTGGFLGYEGSYAQKRNMYPTQTGVAKLKFFGDRWDVHTST